MSALGPAKLFFSRVHGNIIPAGRRSRFPDRRPPGLGERNGGIGVALAHRRLVSRGRSAEERRAVRQAETKPLVEKLKAWLEAQLGAVSGKSVIAEAIR